MYSVRHYIEESGKSIPAGFIHVPASFELSIKNNELPGWPLETIQICGGNRCGRDGVKPSKPLWQ